MSSAHYVGRHGSPRRRVPVPSIGGSRVVSTAVKSVAGVGIVVGSGAFVITPSSALGTQATGASYLGASQSISAVEVLVERESGSTRSMRSTERTAPAVTAPSAKKGGDGPGSDQGAAQSETGELTVEAVAKPEPKPEPETPDANGPDSSSGGSSATDGQAESSQPVRTGAFAAGAAAIGLGPNASGVYSAVRTQFPDMTNIGGYRAGDPGDHGSGRAVDIMVTGPRGDQVAAWLQQHAGNLNIKYVIWKQRIWFPGSSWRSMEDRGSATANHYDHVHVSVH